MVWPEQGSSRRRVRLWREDRLRRCQELQGRRMHDRGGRRLVADKCARLEGGSGGVDEGLGLVLHPLLVIGLRRVHYISRK